MFKGVYGIGWVVLKIWLTPVIGAVLARIMIAIGYSARSRSMMTALPAAVGLVVIIIILRTWIKLYIDLAHAFNQKTSFGIGLIFANPIFMILLGFSAYQYLDGSKAIIENDVITMAAYKIDSWIRSARRNDGKDTITLLKELGELRAEGVIDDEIFEKKKAELLKQL